MSVYHIASNELRMTRVLSVETESPTVKSFILKDERCGRAEPGQFMMLWVPGVDEIPLSILDADQQGRVSVAVKKVGKATEALHRTNVGDLLGVRGPFGDSFTMINGKRAKVLLVAGGTGTVPLLFLAKKLAPRIGKSFFVLGAKTKSELLFLNRFEGVLKGTETKLVTSTEDSSCGITGLCTEVVERILAEDEFNIIYSCGPEKMIRRVFELAEKHRTLMEASLERLMRCAIGLCGSCTIGKYRVCRDGPVFTSRQLREIQNEFGKSKRDMTGRIVPLE